MTDRFFEGLTVATLAAIMVATVGTGMALHYMGGC